MEIDQEKRLNGPWHYDQVVDVFIERTKLRQDENDRQLKRLKRFQKEKSRKLEGALKKEYEKIVALSKETYHRYIATNEALRNLREAKPFLIGPATLDSLIEETPKTYEYAEKGHLPYDNLFFDFVSPPTLTIPSSSTSGKLIGMSLEKISSSNSSRYISDFRIDTALEALGIRENLSLDSDPYVLYAHFTNPEENSLSKKNKVFAHLYLWFKLYREKDTRDPRLIMIGRRAFVEGKGFAEFLIDPEKKSFYELESKDYMHDLKGEEISYNLKPFEFAGRDESIKLANFSVNLINYINSHNVTMTAKSRKPRRTRFMGQFREEPSSKKPFYLITVKNAEKEEGEEGCKQWELNWRVYVRGHPVKYRNEKGDIYLTTWRRPHVRGPSDAPWREQRYEVLAKKLEEERAMYQSQDLAE